MRKLIAILILVAIACALVYFIPWQPLLGLVVLIAGSCAAGWAVVEVLEPDW